MALPYTKVNWQDGVTPENASTLGKMDQGIKDASDELASLDARVDAIEAGGTGGGIEYENDWAAGIAYEAGDVVRYNGIDYLAVNPSTGQTPGAASVGGIGTSFPASPFDGQEFTLVDSLTAPTYAWKFRHVAAKTSNKWVFIGGAPVVVEIATGEAAAGTTYLDLSGPAFTLPVAGSYEITGEANINYSAAGTTTMGLHVDGVEQLAIPNYSPATGGPLYRPGGTKLISGSAGHVVRMRYKTTGMSATFSLRLLEVLPVAVGG